MTSYRYHDLEENFLPTTIILPFGELIARSVQYDDKDDNDDNMLMVFMMMFMMMFMIMFMMIIVNNAVLPFEE